MRRVLGGEDVRRGARALAAAEGENPKVDHPLSVSKIFDRRLPQEGRGRGRPTTALRAPPSPTKRRRGVPTRCLRKTAG